MSKKKVKRITADFSPEAYSCLERIAKELGVTKAEALRRSLSMIDFLSGEMKDGWIPKLVKDNKEKEIVRL